MIRLRRSIAILLFVLLFAATALAQETYQVVRKARLLTKPSSASGQKIRTLHPPELVIHVDDGRSGDYIKVQDHAGNIGWAYEPYLSEETATAQPGGATPTIPSTPTPTGLNNAAAYALSNCAPEGNPSPRGNRHEILKALNREKNRTRGPTESEVITVNLGSFIADDDPNRRTNQAIEVVGYVVDVKPGGPETCNCKSDDPRDYDTHIELLRSPTDQDLPMIVEVTPAWRGLMGSVGRDWSTEGLEASIERRWIRVRGWLFNDSEHRHNAENSNPDGEQLWRKTTWEIHPVTNIEVVSAPIP